MPYNSWVKRWPNWSFLPHPSFLAPELQVIFDRVRQGADFMPWAQTETTLKHQLGIDWRSKVANFDEKPFAAASIGQVHMAELHNGKQVSSGR